MRYPTSLTKDISCASLNYMIVYQGKHAKGSTDVTDISAAELELQWACTQLVTLHKGESSDGSKSKNASTGQGHILNIFIGMTARHRSHCGRMKNLFQVSHKKAFASIPEVQH